MGRRVWVAWLIAAAVTAAPGGARAASWADRLFSETGHDFGPVPRGAKVRHTFLLTNRLTEPVSVVDVRASCGCTTGRANGGLVPPGAQAAVEAEMDTRNFVGRKATVLFVTVMTSSGKQAEARLDVASTILSDIVLNPGSADFGPVARGQTPSLVVMIDRVGQPQWRVERMVSASRALDATLVETGRVGPNVSYRLTVALKPDAPAGVIRDEIRLITNDRESPVVPVQVTALVRGDLTASPAFLNLGQVVSAAGVQGRYLVRASKPFTVKGIEGAGDGFTLATDDTTAKPVHLLTLTYRPDQGSTRGDLRKTFRVHTDLPGEPPLEVSAALHVEP